jgi:hypothetical protein
MDTRIEKRTAGLDARIERGFASIAEVIANLATKEQIIALHAQAVAIETELRDTKRHKLVTRVADLEDKVFGRAATNLSSEACSEPWRAPRASSSVSSLALLDQEAHRA